MLNVTCIFGLQAWPVVAEASLGICRDRVDKQVLDPACASSQPARRRFKLHLVACRLPASFGCQARQTSSEQGSTSNAPSAA